MLSFFTDPYPNELLYSAIARYHFYFGNLNLKDTMVELFGKSTGNPIFEFGSNLKFLCDEIGGMYSAEQIIQHNTVFPFYAQFLPIERKLEVINTMKFLGGARIFGKMGVGWGKNIYKKNNIKYCSICSKEDIETYGEAYIHREHQLEGILICPHHEQLLKNYYRTRDEKKYSEYIRLDSIFLDISDTNNYHEKYQDKLLQISQAAYYLLSNDIQSISLEDILLRYKKFLIYNNFASRLMRVKQNELCNALIEHYGRDFLNFLGAEPDVNDCYSWLQVVTTTKSRLIHPLRHILLILFLAGDIDTFLKEKSEGYTPFGNGPWPCLNPAADHYKKDVINKIKISFNTNQEPVGRFICNCGYIYLRTGSDKNKKDRYRKNSSRTTFGDVWCRRLEEILMQKKYNCYEIAEYMKCSVSSVRKYSKLITEKPIKITQQSEKVIKQLQSKKERFLLILKNNPNINRSKLKSEYSKEYNYIYRYDKQWLLDVLPEAVPNGSIKKHIDWDNRDQELLLQVKEIYRELLNRENLVRISKSLLSRMLNCDNKLHKVNLRNYPCCREFIMNNAESVQEFQLRKCKIVIEQLKEAGVLLFHTRIQKESGINSQRYSLIKEKVEKLMTL